MSKRTSQVFPTTFGPDVSVSDIDLDAEEFIVGGQRLTESRAAEVSDRVAGRPSLTAPGRRSPALNLRVSEQAKRRLDAVASAQGRRTSDVVRDAIDDYLARCS